MNKSATSSTRHLGTDKASGDAPDVSRRDILYVATGGIAAVGCGFAGWTLVDQMNPDASVQALASIEVSIGDIQEGMTVTVAWRGKPLFIRHRTAADIQMARSVPSGSLPDPADDSSRVLPGREQWLIVEGVCPHLGCVPTIGRGEFGGWLCPCHGSQFDTAGRVRVGPAPTNLKVPPYIFLSDTLVRIG